MRLTNRKKLSTFLRVLASFLHKQWEVVLLVAREKSPHRGQRHKTDVVSLQLYQTCKATPTTVFLSIHYQKHAKVNGQVTKEGANIDNFIRDRKK